MSSQPFNPRRFRAVAAADSDSDSEDEGRLNNKAVSADAIESSHGPEPPAPEQVAKTEQPPAASSPAVQPTTAERSEDVASQSPLPRELSVAQENPPGPSDEPSADVTAPDTLTTTEAGADETENTREGDTHNSDGEATDGVSEEDHDDDDGEDADSEEEDEEEEGEEEAEEGPASTREASPTSTEAADVPLSQGQHTHGPSVSQDEEVQNPKTEPSSTNHADPHAERSLMVPPPPGSIFDRLYDTGKKAYLDRKRAAAKREEEVILEQFVRSSANLTFQPQIHESPFVSTSKAIFRLRTTDSRNPNWIAKEQARLDRMSDRMNPRPSTNVVASSARISELAEPKRVARSRPSTGSAASTTVSPGRGVDPKWLERMAKPKHPPAARDEGR